MKLIGQELISFFRNVLGVQPGNGGAAYPFRFSSEQIADYALDGNDFPVRCRASAGVVLDMITDSLFLGVDYSAVSVSSEKTVGFDLFVKGRLWEHRSRSDGKSEGILFELPEGEKRVTLCLPWNTETGINCLHFTDGAMVKPVTGKRKKILAIGDSITQGYICRHPGMIWTNRLSRDLDADVLNRGVGGYGFFGNSLRHADDYCPDLVILSYGTNDYSRQETAAAYERAARSYLARLYEVYPGTPLLLCLPLYRGDEKHRLRERTRNYTLKDACGILTALSAGYENITVLEDTLYPRTPDFYAQDYLHPNDMGNLLHEEEILKAARLIL